MHAVQDQMLSDTPTLWCSTSAVCAGAGYTCCFGRTSVYLMRLLAAELHSTAGLLFSSPCLSGMIMMTLCSMVWDWRVSRAGHCLFIGLAALFLLCLLLFSLSLLSFNVLVLWGWGLRTDRVLIALSQLCIANLF